MRVYASIYFHRPLLATFLSLYIEHVKGTDCIENTTSSRCLSSWMCIRYGRKVFVDSRSNIFKIKIEQIPNTSLAFTRRISGHCLGTFQTAKFCFDYIPPPTR
jgi:hypothetical protein